MMRDLVLALEAIELQVNGSITTKHPAAAGGTTGVAAGAAPPPELDLTLASGTALGAVLTKHQDWLKKTAEGGKDVPQAAKDKLRKRQLEVVGGFRKCKDDKGVQAAKERFLTLVAASAISAGLVQMCGSSSPSTCRSSTWSARANT